jgi:pantoate--beta-alanine ligase
MNIVRSVKGMQQRALEWKRSGKRVGFVPTMGYLHEGHVSLMRRSRKEVGANGIVVVSIFVNPTQFGPQEDLSKYPRDLKRDTRMCREAGVDTLFVPAEGEIYTRDHSTYVIEEAVSKGMEGASRPIHFRGVATVVAKLFNMTLPDVAVFGAKDFQQAAVIKRMTRDLNFPIKIVVAPTIREADGLAMSSRNRYLSAEERAQAVALSKALEEARRQVHESSQRAGPLKTLLRKQIEENCSAKVDYIEFFHPESLEPVEKVSRGIQMALAVFVGQTRLIDNGTL